jgi:hypothetical protein
MLMDLYLKQGYEGFVSFDRSKIMKIRIDFNFLFNIHYEENMHRHMHL